MKQWEVYMISFEEAEIRSNIIKALAHPVRLMMVDLLREGEKQFSEINNVFQVEWYYKKEKDPVINYKAKLLAENAISQQEIDQYEKEISGLVEQSVKFAEESPEPSLEQFLAEVKSL